MLGQLAKILDKAAADAEARNIDPAALLASRLAPDMYPLVKQVRIATDAAVDGAARLAGVEAPVFGGSRDDRFRSSARGYEKRSLSSRRWAPSNSRAPGSAS